MPSPANILVESHRTASTLYITGELTLDRVMEAIGRAEQLHADVRALRVDLRAAHRSESDALRALEVGLRRWRAARRGMTRVKLAPDMETNLVALKYAHRRWGSSFAHQAGLSRAGGDFRFRDRRRAVVTRSLRERADSETR
jgi:ABC-type transporter Mla MlaB component